MKQIFMMEYLWPNNTHTIQEPGDWGVSYIPKVDTDPQTLDSKLDGNCELLCQL